MRELESVCVYCGSSDGKDERFAAAAVELGHAIAAAGIRLVYGGGSRGLMGHVAKTVLADGGQVTGVIPTFLHQREVMLEGVQDLIETEDMHERKRIMFQRSQAFITLPGGIGTLEEVVEMMTWSQLGRHDHPIVLLNVGGFWDPLHHLIGHMGDAGFLHQGVEYDVVATVGEVLPLLRERRRALGASRTPDDDILDDM